MPAATEPTSYRRIVTDDNVRSSLISFKCDRELDLTINKHISAQKSIKLLNTQDLHECITVEPNEEQEDSIQNQNRDFEMPKFVESVDTKKSFESNESQR